MRTGNRSISRRIALRSVVPCCLLGFAVTVVACESVPARNFRGARHYAAGTDALARNEGRLAISELERAATLVPHASEVQNHLGLAYWSEGRTSMARQAFEKAVELDCENVAARSNLQRLDEVDRVEMRAGPSRGHGAEIDAGESAGVSDRDG